MRILVCGATYFTDFDKFHSEFLKILADKRLNNITIISGMAKGADTLAVQFAELYDIPCLKFPADWARYGKGAGPVRNQLMIDQGRPDFIVAFPMKISKGTIDMINRGKLEGIEVIVIDV